MFRSIRWKFIIIYFMLVFIAMIISGVFVIKYLKQYHEEIALKNLEEFAQNIKPQLESMDFEKDKGKFQDLLDQFKTIGFKEEVYVIDAKSTEIKLTNNTINQSKSAEDVVGYWLFIKSTKGKEVHEQLNRTKSLDLAIPIMEKKGDLVRYVLYLRYNMEETNKTLEKANMIIIQATGLALSITVLLSYIIAKSVTEPINAVTDKASKMAMGDFNQYVDVCSDDEIGKLAEMFNHLTRKLKNTLGEMSREKSKLEAILNYMADGLIAVDDEGKILHINPKAKKMFFEGTDFENSDIFDDLVEQYNKELTIEMITKSSEEWVGSVRLVKDDAVYTVNYAPFKDNLSEKKGLVFVFQDITEQDRLDMMRREFVANVSHELKTPLTSIKSYTETLLDGLIEDTETACQFLKVVDHEADRMTRLVRDLLQLSNFDANMVRFEMEYHDYVDLVAKTTSKLQVTAKNRKQTIDVDIQAEELIGYFDYDRIEQVLQNILTNAIKYTPEGGKLEVCLKEQKGCAFIEVKDNGIGIPAPDLERIFERFYRVDKARARNLGGTGLGLSIAKEIIQSHDGTILINSIVEKGTTVQIMIPLKLA